MEVPYNNLGQQDEVSIGSSASHLKVLLWKQYLTQTRSKKSILCVFLSPFILCVILFLIQLTVSAGLKYENPDPPITDAGTFQKCSPLKGFDSCISIGYGIYGDETAPWVEHTINYIAQKTGLTVGTDIKEIYRGKNYTAFNDYFVKNPGETLIGLLFCTTDQLPYNGSLPLPANCQQFVDTQTWKSYKLTPYLIVYNHSLISTDYQTNPQMPFPTYPTALQLKILVDNSIVDFYGEQDYKTYINVKTQSYPQTEFRFFEGFDIVDQQGGIYFFIAPIITFIVLLNEITTEKEKRLRQGLSVVGVSHFTYWLHWIILAVVYAVIVTFSIVAGGHLFNFKVFTRAPILVHCVLFFTFTLAMEFFALFVYTLVPTVKVANTVGYGILLLGIVMQLFLSNAAILQYLYDTTNDTIYKVIVNIFLVYPAFSFTAIYTDIMLLAGDTFSTSQAMWVSGPGYHWADFIKSHTGKTMGGDPFEYPSSLNFLLWMIGDIVIFTVLIIYMDHVIAHNRGSGAGPLFFLQKSFWRSSNKTRRVKKRISEAPEDSDNESLDGNIDTVAREKEKVIRHNDQGTEARGIRISNLSKVYRQSMCGRRSKNDVKALSNIFLEIGEGELLGLLGHNGAGKTTLINILTGVLGGFEGKITISGFDIELNKDEVKKVVGVCPQFDILWYELTAKEHLYMFAKIKGIPVEAIDEQIRKALEEVNLTKVKDVWAGTFSGGMKRRLSMAIAGIGDPSIIFLDEPTTGMDPKNRRQVWELIKNLKKNRAVILTTHAMEEADALSDRIAVIVDGRFKCIGNSLFLKNNFGEGYRLTLIVDPENSGTVKKLMGLKIPSAKIVDESGGSLMFSIPSTQIKELQSFFKVIEDKDKDEASAKLKDLIHDWGLSNTTLEEVFMKVTAKKEKKTQ